MKILEAIAQTVKISNEGKSNNMREFQKCNDDLQNILLRSLPGLNGWQREQAITAVGANMKQRFESQQQIANLDPKDSQIGELEKKMMNDQVGFTRYIKDILRINNVEFLPQEREAMASLEAKRTELLNRHSELSAQHSDHIKELQKEYEKLLEKASSSKEESSSSKEEKNNSGSLIDDYANPNLDPPSYMDPED